MQTQFTTPLLRKTILTRQGVAPYYNSSPQRQLAGIGTVWRCLTCETFYTNGFIASWDGV
jgi:hypothetical protein